MAQIVYIRRKVQGDAASPELVVQRWERPALRRLAANQAEKGGNPCNDSGGTGRLRPSKKPLLTLRNYSGAIHH